MMAEDSAFGFNRTFTDNVPLLRSSVMKITSNNGMDGVLHKSLCL